MRHDPYEYTDLGAPGLRAAVRFDRDLNSAVDYVKMRPKGKGTMATVSGKAAPLPDRSIAAELPKRYNDILYHV